MRIIGGKDYYDSASAYGIDPGIVFLRKEWRLTNSDMEAIGKFTPISWHLRPDNDETPTWKTRYEWEKGNVIPGVKLNIWSPVVIFCGKVYQGIFITETRGSGLSEEKIRHRFWQADKFEAFLAENKLRVTNGYHYKEQGITYIESSLEPYELKGAALEYLIKKQITIILPKEREGGPHPRNFKAQPGWAEMETDFVANPDTLKEWDFQKCMDPVTAFQEISQWVGGTLAAAGPNTVEITDDTVKAHKAGFDKWSFRKKTENSKD